MLQRVIEQRRKDLGGGFEVGRVLPFREQRMVGPFIFFDHIGPTEFPPGIPRSMDVRPHPHIGLSTISYLFAGEMMHRDSVGSEQAIRPGEVNWMTAGRGITHSERFEQARAHGGPMHGIQAWVALPDDYPERAAYVVRGSIEADGSCHDEGTMLVFQPGKPAELQATCGPALLMLLGGEPVGPRFIEWNFVSSSKERIEQAKADWRAGRMKLPDLDHHEWIPLPGDPERTPPEPMS